MWKTIDEGSYRCTQSLLKVVVQFGMCYLLDFIVLILVYKIALFDDPVAQYNSKSHHYKFALFESVYPLLQILMD